jgi:hypothetical protein
VHYRRLPPAFVSYKAIRENKCVEAGPKFNQPTSLAWQTNFNHQPTGDQHDHKHIIPQVAGTAICQATARAESPSSSEDSASAPNAAEKQANLRAFPG